MLHPKRVGAASALVVLLAAAAPSLGQDGDWPMFRHDPQRTARQTLPGNIDVPAVRWTIPTGGNHPPARLILADVNLDGIVEAVMIRGGRVVARQPDGTLIWASEPIGAGWLLAAQDFDGDGRPEVFASSSYQGIFAIDGSTGDILWRTPVREGVRYSNVAFPVDVDGDGRLELYVPDLGTGMGGRGTASVYSFPDGLTGAHEVNELDTAEHGYWSGHPQDYGDLNGDGSLEVITLSHDRVIAYDLTTGLPLFTSEALGEFPYGIGRVTVVDLDDDGLDEVVVASNYPSGRFDTTRRLLVLEVDDGALVVRWSIVIDGTEGSHLFPHRPVADIIPGGPLEIATSIFEPATGWRTLVFAGDAMSATPVAELPGMALLALADLDGDGSAELILRDADEVALSPFGTIRAYSFSATEPSEPVELWSIARASLPIESTPWFASELPVGFGPMSGSARATILRLDLDGDERPDHIIAIDASGAEIARSERRAPVIGGLRSCYELCDAVAVRLDGSIEVIGPDLLMLNDILPPSGVADLVEMNHLTAPPVVGHTSIGPLTLIADSSGALRAYQASEHGLAERWSTGAGEREVISASSTMFLQAHGDSEPLVLFVARGATGGIEIQQVVSVDSSEISAVSLTSSREISIPNPFTPLHGLSGLINSVVAGLRDGRNNMMSYYRLNIESTELSLLTPLSRDATGGGDSLTAAFDISGDGIDDLLLIQARDARVIDGESGGLLNARIPISTVAQWAKLSIVDVNGDGEEDIATAGVSGTAVLDSALDLLWQNQESGSYYNPITSAYEASGDIVLASTRSREARFDAFDGYDGALRYSVCPAGGVLWTDDFEARAAGVQPGSLTSAIASYNITANGEWSFLFGSTDGFLYVVSAEDGVLEWSHNFRASIGEPIVADSDGDGFSEILVPVGDGSVQVIERAISPAPAAVYDTDGTYVAEGPDDDLDELPSGRTAGASWVAVSGATSYEHQLLLDDSVVVVPWTDVGSATDARYEGLALQLGRRYSTGVRTRANVGPSERVSVDVSSDGFIVVDRDAPTVVVGVSPDPFFPEADGDGAMARIRVELADEVGLRSYLVEITGPDGERVAVFGPFEIGGTRLVREHEWSGRDIDEAPLSTGRYRVIATAVDVAGNEGNGFETAYLCSSYGEDHEGLCQYAIDDAGPDADNGDDEGGPGDADAEIDVNTWRARGGACACSNSGIYHTDFLSVDRFLLLLLLLGIG